LSREDRVPTGRCSGLLEVKHCAIELTLRMRCTSSMSEIVFAALRNRPKPSMTFVRDSMLRWFCSIGLFKYFEDLTWVSAGSVICSGSKPSTVSGVFNSAVWRWHSTPSVIVFMPSERARPTMPRMTADAFSIYRVVIVSMLNAFTNLAGISLP
jgi:hypothetical protein